MWICYWLQYGYYKTTVGFATEAEAEKHADRHLRNKEHYTHVTVHKIELPKGYPDPLPATYF